MNETERRARIAQLLSEITERANEIAQLASGDLPTPEHAAISPTDFVGHADLVSFCDTLDVARTTGTRLWYLLVSSKPEHIRAYSRRFGLPSLDIRLPDSFTPVDEFEWSLVKRLVVSVESLRAVTSTLAPKCMYGFSTGHYNLLTAWVNQL